MAYCSNLSACCCGPIPSTISRSTSESWLVVPCTGLPGTGSFSPTISPGWLCPTASAVVRKAQASVNGTSTGALLLMPRMLTSAYVARKLPEFPTDAIKCSRMQTAEVVIIGGGIVGSSIAYHLTAAGCKDILVIERETAQGKGSTGKSMGGVRAQFSTPVNIQMSLYSIPFYASFDETLR